MDSGSGPIGDTQGITNITADSACVTIGANVRDVEKRVDDVVALALGRWLGRRCVGEAGWRGGHEVERLHALHPGLEKSTQSLTRRRVGRRGAPQRRVERWPVG